jgi:hypothetical protein
MKRINTTSRWFASGHLVAAAKLPPGLGVLLVAMAGAAISACDRAGSVPVEAGTQPQTKVVAPAGTSVPSRPEADPLSKMPDAQRESAMPQQPVQTDAQAMQDPFKPVLDESNRQRAAAAVSPFGSGKSPR